MPPPDVPPGQKVAARADAQDDSVPDAVAEADEAFFQALMAAPKGAARDTLIAREKVARRYRRAGAARGAGIVRGDAGPRWLTWFGLALAAAATVAWWLQR